MITREMTHKPEDTYEEDIYEIYEDEEEPDMNVDYTKWHQWFVATITPEEFARRVEEYERTHPYTGNAKIII